MAIKPARQRTLTLRGAIVLAVVIGLLAPALLIVGFSWFKKYDDEIALRTKEVLRQNIDFLESNIKEPLWNVDRDSANNLVESMMRNPDIVSIEIRDGTNQNFAAAQQTARHKGYVASVRRNVVYRNKALGSIQVEVTSARLRKIVLESLTEYVIALFAQMVLAIVLILVLLEYRLIGPLRRLGSGAKKLADAQLDTPFTWKRQDEIGLLSQRFEATRISLQRLFEELGQKNQQLERDIEKRQHIEQELVEREARFRALVAQSPVAIIEWDMEFCVIEWNSAAERIFGYTRPQALGQHVSFIVPNHEREAGTSIFQEITRQTCSVTEANDNLRADGLIITCHWNHTHIADQNGDTGHLLSMAEDITEKRRAEIARRFSEAKFSGAFQCIPDLASITDLATGIFHDVNSTFEQHTGYSREELIGTNAISLDLWADPEQRDALLTLLKQGEMVRNFTWLMRTKNGDLRQCLLNSTIFTVGTTHYMLALIRDITDQQRLEQQKAEADLALLRLAQGSQGMGSESFFEFLVTDLASALHTERAFIGLTTSDAPDRVRTMAYFANGKLIENCEFSILGAACEETLAGTLCVFPSDVQQQFPQDIGLAKYGLHSFASAPLRDGHNTIGILAVMATHPLGNPDLVKSLLQVFSERASAELERKRAEEALRNSELSFATIFHSSPVAMSVTQVNNNYRIKDVNKAFISLFMLEKTQVLGKNATELELYCNNTVRLAAIATLEKTGKQESLETWMNRGDGDQIFVSVFDNVFLLNGTKFITSSFEDVTEQFNNEIELHDLNINLEQRVNERTVALQKANQDLASTLETLSRAQEELVRSDKLAALGSLVAGIAHELNTPIGNSLMVASTLADQTEAFGVSYAGGLKRSVLETYMKDAGKASDILVRNLHRAANLVTSFKQVAVDQTSSQRRNFSLTEVISEIMLTLWPTIKKTSYKVEHIVPKDLFMDSYPGPLGQVLTNLINNALIHGFEGRKTGTVLINVKDAGAGWIEMTVGDDGIGIPQDNLKRIYDPFFTTKLGAGGSGLGLNITHNIVTGLLAGRIAVHSEIGVGTVFTVMLPSFAP